MMLLRLTLLLTAVLLTACDNQQETTTEAPVVTVLPDDTSADDPSAFSNLITAQESYRDHLLALASVRYDITLDAVQKMNTDLSALAETPNDRTLEQARTSWRNAYTAYLQSLPSTSIPVDEPSDWKSAGLTRSALTETINPWPLEPGYIDYYDGYPYTGSEKGTTHNLSEGSLQEQHRFADVSYVSLGFHVIEFLLWGENGQRPASDFNPATAKSATPDRPVVKNQQRRAEYLRTAGQMLQKNLQRLQLRWQLDNGFYSITTAVRSGASVLNGSLISLRQMLSKDLAGRYLKEPSSPFSQTGNEDAQVILGSVRELLVPVDAISGVRALLQDKPEKIARLETALSMTDECLSTATEYPLCQAEMLELLTAFNQTASQLHQAVHFPVNAWAEPVLIQPSGSGSQE